MTVVASHLTGSNTTVETEIPAQVTQVVKTYRLVAVSLIVEHGGSLGSIAPGLHGPQPHLVLWKTLQQISRWV